jgi:hypothetical protein
LRSLIERFFSKLKSRHGVTTCCDKTADPYLEDVLPASVKLWKTLSDGAVVAIIDACQLRGAAHEESDIDGMLVENSATEWPEDESPYVAVARVTANPQQSWSEELWAEIESGLAFNPWIGLAAHRPLGSIMRARKPAYAAAREYRGQVNGIRIEEPSIS